MLLLKYKYTTLKHTDIRLSKKTIKLSRLTNISSSYFETIQLSTYTQFLLSSNFIHKLFGEMLLPLRQKREIANVVLKDLLGLYLT